MTLPVGKVTIVWCLAYNCLPAWDVTILSRLECLGLTCMGRDSLIVFWVSWPDLYGTWQSYRVLRVMAWPVWNVIVLSCFAGHGFTCMERDMFTSLQYSRHLYWLPVRARISYKTACLCFNAITTSTPAYLSDLLHLYSPSQSLRSSADTCLLKILLYKCKTKGGHAFTYFGPSVWNSLKVKC